MRIPDLFTWQFLPGASTPSFILPSVRGAVLAVLSVYFCKFLFRWSFGVFLWELATIGKNGWFVVKCFFGRLDCTETVSRGAPSRSYSIHEKLLVTSSSESLRYLTNYIPAGVDPR